MKNKKRMASLLLAGCMALSAVPAAFAADAEQTTVVSDEEQKPTSGTCGEHLTWSLSEDGTLTISGTGEMENYDNSESFPKWDRDLVQNIVIESGVTSIGDNAFGACDNLKTVTFPDSLEEIGESAFFGCSMLQSVEIPQSVTQIGAEAFGHCGHLKRAILPEGITAIKEAMFSNCGCLEEVYIPKSVQAIEDYGFYGQ